MPATERSYLVDSSIYVFRAWFTLPDSITDREGRPANAVYGFSDFVLRFLTEVAPARVAFAFDESLESSHRNEIFPDYKANRESAPEELKHQFGECRALLRTLGIAELASPRYEADDLIGTLARHERAQGRAVTFVTSDKDLAQLLEGPQDEWWEFAKDKRLDRRGIEKTFGVAPELIADQLAIAGDKIDNIPGVPGIGMATAAKLLRKFGGLQALLADLPRVETMQLRGAARLRRLLEGHQETVRLSRRLTEIHCEVELPDGLSLTPKRPDIQALGAFFDRLCFGDARRERWLGWAATAG